MLVFSRFFGLHSCGAGSNNIVLAALGKLLFRRMMVKVLETIRRLPWATTKAHYPEQKEEWPAS
jgi:hypothetical protein